MEPPWGRSKMGGSGPQPVIEEANEASCKDRGSTSTRQPREARRWISSFVDCLVALLLRQSPQQVGSVETKDGILEGVQAGGNLRSRQGSLFLFSLLSITFRKAGKRVYVFPDPVSRAVSPHQQQTQQVELSCIQKDRSSYVRSARSPHRNMLRPSSQSGLVFLDFELCT